jgi:hypothetical protein
MAASLIIVVVACMEEKKLKKFVPAEKREREREDFFAFLPSRDPVLWRINHFRTADLNAL